MMPAGFELAATCFDGSVKRYRNSRLEVTVKNFDDDPMHDDILAKTLKLSDESFSIAQTKRGMLVMVNLGIGTRGMTDASIDKLVKDLSIAKQDVLDIQALVQHLYPDIPPYDVHADV